MIKVPNQLTLNYGDYPSWAWLTLLEALSGKAWVFPERDSGLWPTASAGACGFQPAHDLPFLPACLPHRPWTRLASPTHESQFHVINSYKSPTGSDSLVDTGCSCWHTAWQEASVNESGGVFGGRGPRGSSAVVPGCHEGVVVGVLPLPALQHLWCSCQLPAQWYTQGHITTFKQWVRQALLFSPFR